MKQKPPANPIVFGSQRAKNQLALDNAFIASCPFCNSQDIRRTPDYDECNRCGTTGPKQLVDWNQRVGANNEANQRHHALRTGGVPDRQTVLPNVTIKQLQADAAESAPWEKYTLITVVNGYILSYTFDVEGSTIMTATKWSDLT